MATDTFENNQFDNLSDEELTNLRRTVLYEQERRDLLATGLEQIGAEIRVYADAARMPLGGRTDVELGQFAVDCLTMEDHDHDGG